MGTVGRAPLEDVPSSRTHNASYRYGNKSSFHKGYLIVVTTGEDLGSVPDEVRVSLRRLGISATKVCATSLSIAGFSCCSCSCFWYLLPFPPPVVACLTVADFFPVAGGAVGAAVAAARAAIHTLSRLSADIHVHCFVA